ncbi:MAG TPA: HAMP domain-containing sensor histidine kinase [Phycisphaerae bacterium]|nr:HAMP domain-containing sensor histidine kinase [Phycisphaerae bacterium]
MGASWRMHRFLRDSSAAFRRARRRLKDLATGRREAYRTDRFGEGLLALRGSAGMPHSENLQKALGMQNALVANDFILTDSPFTYAGTNGKQGCPIAPGDGEWSLLKTPPSVLGGQPTQERDSNKKRALSRARESVLDIEQFVHDLDNLLTVIANRAELAQTDLASDQRCGDSIRAIKAATRRAMGLSELLRRTESNAEVPKDHADLAQVIRATVDSARAWIPRDVTIAEDLPVGDPVLVYGNFTQLQRVVQNLLSNAIDSLRPGGHVFVSLELTDKCSARPQSNTPRSNAQDARHRRKRWHCAHAVLRVTDNGVGMDASILGRVFQPGFTRKLRGTGSGLGMSIVADIVHDHGGDITVESRFGEGTEVIIRIPLARIAESDPRHD